MAYNYGPPGGYGGPPGGGGGQPDFLPPGMGAPGMPSSAGMQGQFQPPPNMPPINFNAPVIRLGVDGPRGGDRSDGRDRGGRDGARGSNAEPLGGRSRAGLGADPGRDRNLERDRAQVRENMMALQPPTREEVSRTIFVGGLSEDMLNDESLVSILRCPGKLRRWTRARDANDKPCKFGFAEYEDVESLEAAAEIFENIQVPLFNPDGSVKKVKNEDDMEEQEEIQKAQLLVVVDDASREYIEQWKGRKKESDNDRQFRLDSCKEALEQTLTGLVNQAAYTANGANGDMNGDRDGDVNMDDNADGIETINLPNSLEDELADIPAEMRATVAEEIKAFRDRSKMRDIERDRREKEVDQEDRQRAGATARVNRLASPGPTSSANGVPVGPRGQQGVQGAPSGPRGFRGAQLPSDYANGVAFVPGAGPNGGVYVPLNHEDDDADESDEELERRRQEKRNAELDKEYNIAVNKWHDRARRQGRAQERIQAEEERKQRELEKARETMLIRLADWNDEEEAERAKHPYYRDRISWARNREHAREIERKRDDEDREKEEKENAEEQRRLNEARGMANDFLGSLGVDTRAGDQGGAANRGGFKFSLGAAAAKTKQSQVGSKRGMQDVEGLLEDEEDAAAASAKRPELKPLQDTSTLPTHGQDLTDDEKASARRQLAGEIPTDTEDLFAFPVKWDKLTKSLLDAQIRPFVEKKVVEYLGVLEDLLVDAVMDGINSKQQAKEIVEELEGPLEDEAEVLVKKVWRLLVFWGECESRGLSA